MFDSDVTRFSENINLHVYQILDLALKTIYLVHALALVVSVSQPNLNINHHL